MAKQNLTLIRSLDSKVQKYFETILPRNLTARYIIGLAIIGILTLGGQTLIQTSLIKLTSDSKIIRVLEKQLNDSEDFYQEIIKLEVISDETDFTNQVNSIKNDASNLLKNHEEVIYQMDKEIGWGLVFPKKLEPYKKDISSAFTRLSTVLNKLDDLKYSKDPSLRIKNSIITESIMSENNYRNILNQLEKSYEETSRGTLEYFKKLQWILFLTTLLILLIEALYVFRPAVHRVYSAIQSRSDFLARLSHEIRNPMNSILGMSQLLSKTKPSPQQKNYIKILENSSLGLLEMLNNLLDYSVIESSKLKLESISTDIYSVVEKTLDLVTTKIQEKDLELTLDIAPDVPLKILSDPIRLQQVLVNLLSNAAKFTEVGFITCKVRLVSSDDKKIQFSIVDSGIGIEPVKLDSIFESFVQENTSVRRKYGGTGLGLTIAREIVMLMGGELTVESKKGVGSTFSFTIPIKVDGSVKTINDYIPMHLTGKQYLLIDKNKKASDYIQSVIENNEGTLRKVSHIGDFNELYTLMTKDTFSKVLIDASTLGSSLEDFFIFLNEKKYKMNNICILFRYINANYLFDLLNNYEVHSFFPKPIKPVEFINYLSGYTVENSLAVESEETVLTSERRYKILIAEDSADNRTILQIYLGKHSVDLFFAENGKRAVELFYQQKFDIVFMDIQMPEMDGITATKIIREYEKSRNLKATPILAFSAHKPQDIFNPGEQVYFNDFVLKPINSNVVKAKLKQYLQFSELKKEENTENPPSKKEEFDVSDLIPSYLERRTQEIDQMKDYITNNDLKNLVRIGHQLKGSAKSYGFEELGELGDQLEKLAQLEEKMDEIKAVVTKITNKISDYKKTHLN